MADGQLCDGQLSAEANDENQRQKGKDLALSQEQNQKGRQPSGFAAAQCIKNMT